MNEEFNTRLLRVLDEAKCSKTVAAKKIGVSSAYLSQLCSGVRNPSDRTISDICRVFGVDPIWLRTGVGEMFSPQSREEELAEIFAKVQIGDDDKSRLIRAMARMPDEAFPAFLQFVEQLYRALSEEK